MSEEEENKDLERRIADGACYLLALLAAALFTFLTLFQYWR